MPVATPATGWSLAGRIATAGDGRVVALDAPERGLLLDGGRDRVLAVDLRTPCPAGDHWIRGDDLIAVYEPPDPRRLRATAMWRLHPHHAASTPAACELTLSAQTALVESDGLLSVTSDLAADGVRARRRDGGWCTLAPGAQPPDDATCLLVRRPTAAGPTAAVLVAAHPSDVRRIAVQWHDGRVAIACWLFTTALEKGVLLRGRVTAAVGPAADAEAWADRLADAFAAAPPPLTA